MLAALTNAGEERRQQHLERVKPKLGQLLYEPGLPQRHAYSPTSAIVSLLSLMANGASAEIAVEGHSGSVGTSPCLGGATANGNASVLIAGRGFRIDAQMIRDELNRAC